MFPDPDVFSEVDSCGSSSGQICRSLGSAPRKRKRCNNLRLKISSLDLSFTESVSSRSMESTRRQEQGDGTSFYYIITQGTGRRACEDTCFVDLANHYFSIFDGHGGFHAAEFAAPRLCQKIVYQCKTVQESFHETDREFIEAERQSGFSKGVCGTTALAALFREGTLRVAHVGDSRAVLMRKQGPIALTTDHSPTRQSEALRIEGEGGFVLCNRVNGTIAVSRAIGDSNYKPFVSSEPEVVELGVSQGDEYLLLATDGLWSVVNEQQACNAVAAGGGDLKTCCQALINLALTNNSSDDIAVLLVNLNLLSSNASSRGTGSE
mmetsp:Transcript_10517/g.32176  ORF Transcript_10517/g.32176 Transcript_10517/m.32176 type:complete len:322 (+) Transcript_10517:1132-2097(+)